MILCQEGFRPGSMISTALSSGAIDGVVVSPRYHAPASMLGCISAMREHSAAAYIILDPEFHVGVTPGGRVGKLAEHPHYHDDLGWNAFTSGRVRHYVDEVLTPQAELPLTRLVAPGIPIDSLSGWQCSASLSLFDEAVAWAGQPRAASDLLLTLVLCDEMLSERQSVDELLDELTRIDCRGFYLTVPRQNTADTLWCGAQQDVALGSLLYMLHILSLNDYEVICGYTDFAGILMLGAGAAGVASGWFKKQRLFDLARFGPATQGGRQPKGSYASFPLMNWIPLSPDLEILEGVGLLDQVATHGPHDDLLRDARREERWNLPASVTTFWSGMGQAGTTLEALPFDERIAVVAEYLRRAEETWRRIRSGTGGGPRLSSNDENIQSWDRALGELRGRLGR